VQAFHKGQKKIDIEVGETYPYYDLASLTKVIFTTTIMMRFYEKKPRVLEDNVLKYLDWYAQPSLSVRHLLTHTSGLTWWKPLYKMLDLNQPREARWQALKNILAQEKPEPIAKAVYSDLDFLFLGYILESEYKKPLLEIWKEVQDEFKLSHTHFHVGNKPVYAVSKYAPTEECPWRQKRLQGEAHDENTWALGGVAPHAGLFGNMTDLSSWMLQLREIFLGQSKSKFISQETSQIFFQRAIAQNVGDWALGFMMKSAQNSTAGTVMSRNTVGHTGFTGTSVWYDMGNDLIICVLSNRVYFGREKADQFLKVRVAVHDSIAKSILN